MSNLITIPEVVTEIEGDRAFPIFKLEIHLSYDGIGHDCISGSRLYQELPSAEQTLNDLKEWWEGFINKEPFGEDKTPIIEKHPIIQSLSVHLVEYETWCIGRFSHRTYLVNRSDEELLRSFHRFIARKLPLHLREEYCLMGAEDTWRIGPPCHCVDCTRLGVTHIEH